MVHHNQMLKEIAKMAEADFDVQVIMKDYKCDKCGLGRMRPIALSPIDQTIVHKCTKCDHQQRFKQKYPIIDFKQGEEIKTSKLIVDGGD